MAPLIPAPVRAAREKIKAAGKELDREGLITVLSKLELNNLANNMRNTMAAEPKKKYKELKTDDDRRDWLVYYLIDPKSAICTGFNKTTAFDEEQNKKKEAWITEEQMGGSKYLNSASHAKLVCDAKIFDVQDHEIEALAAAGVKQHRFSWSQLERTTGFRKEAGITATAELTPEEYAQMRDHMDQQRLEPQAKKAKTTTPKVLSEEEKQNRIANTAKSAGLRKLKQQIDKVATELDKREADAANLPKRGYPQELQIFYDGKIKEMRTKIEGHHNTYSEHVVKETKMETEEAKALATELETSLTNLDTAAAEFNKNTGKNLKLLAAGD